MRFSLPKIYPITDVSLSAHAPVEQVRMLIEGGATLIQLRDKKSAAVEFYNNAQTALAIAGEKNVRIIINDRADIALCLKADGVHLGQDDLPPVAARRLLGGSAIIGFSTHNVWQAIAAAKMPIDYLAVGPIFETSTKENAEAVVGLDGLRKVRAAIGDFPLVAIGGITLADAPEVFRAGADSIAIIGELYRGGDIAGQMKRFLTLANEI